MCVCESWCSPTVSVVSICFFGCHVFRRWSPSRWNSCNERVGHCDCCFRETRTTQFDATPKEETTFENNNGVKQLIMRSGPNKGSLTQFWRFFLVQRQLEMGIIWQSSIRCVFLLSSVFLNKYYVFWFLGRQGIVVTFFSSRIVRCYLRCFLYVDTH